MKNFLIICCLIFLGSPLFSEPAPIVVGVHGFMGSRKSLNCIKHSLCEDGFDVYIFEYDSFNGSIRSHGHDLACYVARIAELNPDREIHFITQSLGALVLRASLNDPACPESAKTGRAVLIAPPNQGSELGRSFEKIGDLYRCLGFELAYEITNYTQCDIIALGPIPEEMELLIIAGSKGSSFWTHETNDGIITINETAMDHSFYFQTYPVYHTRILQYRPAIDLAKYFIYCGFDCDNEEEAKAQSPCLQEN